MEFLEFPAILPVSLGVGSPKIEDPLFGNPYFGRVPQRWLRQLTASWFDPVSGEPYN
jgi:hypothetical protein